MDAVTIIQFDPHAIEAYGAVREGVHIAGYTYERACTKLEWLLDNDRWRGVGEGFDDINEFMASIRLDSFRPLAEQRKRIAQRIKELQPKVSNRAIAKTLGVGRSTVNRDTGPNGPAVDKKASDISAAESSSGPFGPPTIAGPAAAKLVARKENAVDRRDERLANIAEIAKGNTELGTSTRYPIIYADPPWRYENPPMGGGNRSIENHYPTMTLEEIIALPVAQLAADDALLYLWATAPKLAERMKVIEPWGFEYRTNAVWDKEVIGTGYHLPQPA
jgi:hypothetical protein